MFENLREALKKPFSSQKDELKNPSNTTSDLHTVKSLSDDDFDGTMVFGDLQGYEWQYGGTEQSLMMYQNRIIDMYRKLAKNPDINYAIDIIVNEMAFTVEEHDFKIDIDEENNEIKKRIGDVFGKVQDLLNLKEQIHPLIRQMYIDGQLNVVLTYDESNIKDGIKKAIIVEPHNLYYDKDSKLWKYAPDTQMEQCLYGSDSWGEEYDETYTNDEFVHIDYGLYSKVTLGDNARGRVNLGYLENALKPANMLDTLENMLVPMRYSRSVSRRMFNIDVADLPPKKAKELMDKIRAEFKYKKTYDTENGTIRNMQSTQPLVEDYWMSNRSGARGTTVDTIDEKGAIMDMDDIIYSTKKLFTALKIPSSRNPYIDQDGGNFSYETSDATNEEMMFYLHIDRLRIPVTNLLKEILKREIISTGVMTDKEWEKYKNKIKINFTSRSIFLENMAKDLFIKSVGNWQEIKEEVGRIVSLETAVSTTFGWSNDQLQEEMDKIKDETNNPIYSAFYQSNDESF